MPETRTSTTREAAAPARARSAHKPYRWGKFQGWLLIALGVIMAGTVVLFLRVPDNKSVRAFALLFVQVNDFGLGLVNTGRELLYLCELHYIGAAIGMLMGYLLQTVGTGIGLLKKRMFGLVLFLLLAVRAVAQSYITSLAPVALALTLGPLPYYYKRWREFRIP